MALGAAFPTQHANKGQVVSKGRWRNTHVHTCERAHAHTHTHTRASPVVSRADLERWVEGTSPLRLWVPGDWGGHPLRAGRPQKPRLPQMLFSVSMRGRLNNYRYNNTRITEEHEEKGVQLNANVFKMIL